MNYLQPERLDRLAREYALGTLSARARRRFDRTVASSAVASQAVDAWKRRLSVLEAPTGISGPAASTWQSIEARLFKTKEPARASHHWARWLSAGTSRMVVGILTGALACVVLVRVQPNLLALEARSDTLPASYVGLLLDDAGHPAVVASSRRLGRQLVIKLLHPLAIPAGQTAQLWALSPGRAPVPVGQIPAQGSAQIALPASSEQLFSAVKELAVSFEPELAKPGSTPTAPFVLRGHCVKVWQRRQWRQAAGSPSELSILTDIHAEVECRGLDTQSKSRRLRSQETATMRKPHMTLIASTPDLGALKARQQVAQASGDQAVIGTNLQIVGGQLAEVCDIGWDQRVPDVAAGNGNVTLAAARRGDEVTSTDYVAAPLDRGAERLIAKMQVGDA